MAIASNKKIRKSLLFGYKIQASGVTESFCSVSPVSQASAYSSSFLPRPNSGLNGRIVRVCSAIHVYQIHVTREHIFSTDTNMYRTASDCSISSRRHARLAFSRLHVCRPASPRVPAATKTDLTNIIPLETMVLQEQKPRISYSVARLRGPLNPFRTATIVGGQTTWS